MFQRVNPDGPEQIYVLLIPDFSMLELSAILEPLRIASRLTQKTCYKVDLLSIDGRPVKASNGLDIEVDRALADVTDMSSLILCASFHPEEHDCPELLNGLRSLAAVN